MPKQADPINPTYYQGDRVMCIIEDFGLGYCTGQVIKYVLRAGKKHDSPLEDLKKAQWYLQREIDSLGKGGSK
jgi:hypothetical protein